MKVLLVKLSALGDILHAIPAAAAIRASLPGARLGWVVDRRYAAVLSLFPALDDIHILDPGGWGKTLREGRPWRGWSQARRGLGEIRRAGYDVAIDLQGLVKSAVVTALSGARRSAGFARGNCREPVAARFYRERVAVDPSLPVDLQLLSLAESVLGPLSRRDPAPLDVPAAAREEAGEFLAQAGAPRPAVLVIGAGWPTKVLPLPAWREVLGGMLAGPLGVGGVVILSGTAEEQSRAAELADEFPRVAVFHRLPLSILAGVLDRSRVVVGGDTGIVHLAALLGAPTVSFYGASLGARSGPRGAQHRQVQATVSCSPCFSRSCGDIACMPSIPAGEILSAAREVIR